VYRIYLLQNRFPYNVLFTKLQIDETSGQRTDYKFVKNAFVCAAELQGRL